MLHIARRPDATITLADARRSFDRRCQARGLAEGTIAFYQRHLQAFADFLAAHDLGADPATISPGLLREFLAARMEHSAAAAHQARATLSVFCKFLLSEEIIAENPIAKVERLRRPRRLMPVPSPEHVARLLAVASAKTFSGTRLRALLLVLIDCGLRASELTGLRLGDLDWTDDTMVVNGKGRKERQLPFGRACRLALEGYLLRRGDLDGVDRLFVTCYGEPMTRWRLRALLTRAAAKAGVPEFGPHCFRRYFAVAFLRQGGDVFSLQKLLGHTSLEMSRLYAELSGEDVIVKHRAASPGDAFLSAVRPTSGRRRLR